MLIRGDAQGTVAEQPDRLGTTIDIQGDVQAPTVEIEGALDEDFLQINTLSGINASGTTVLRGGDNTDRFFVRGVAGPTSLQGQSGADRFYISSNAQKSNFTGTGSYNDDPAADVTTLDDRLAFFLSHLSGNLANMDGLSIDPGSGGGGGTLDSAFFSADDATAALTDGQISNGA